jgi:ABC-type sugar transport system ATPase subunit
MEPVLQLEHISKSFPGVKALADVHFDVRAGEVHALLGENGAGKSTLIKIISGVYQPDSGAIRVDGQERRFDNPRASQSAGIATIYQELSLYPELTVAENIYMGHAPRTRFGALDWGDMRRRSQDILESLNIHDMDVGRKVGTMSVGNRQRVEIAKALSLNAKILIMDEPTAALTESDVERLFSIVRLLRERGVGIIYISHRLQEVFELADRVTVLRDGQYVGTKEVADVTENELITMMVGRTIDDLFPKLPATIGEPVLEVTNLERRPNTRGVSLTLRAGEIVGMAGLI